MLQKNNTEAWARVAEFIFATAPELENRSTIAGVGGTYTSGLCMLASRMGAYGAPNYYETCELIRASERAVRHAPRGDGLYLHTPGRWTDGIRLDFALRRAGVPLSVRRRVLRDFQQLHNVSGD
jgi:hypothetical protein